MVVRAFALLCLTSSCAPAFVAERAPEVDALFQDHVTWRGADAAYSVALDDERVLWLFGDSWVGDGPPDERSGRSLVRNTLGVQTPHAPGDAEVRFFPQDNTAFFEDGDGTDDTWLWPGASVVVEGKLLMLLFELGATDEGFGFVTTGTAARLVDDPSGAPDTWTVRTIEPPPRPVGVNFGGGGFVDDGQVYFYGTVEPGSHDVFVGRVSEADAARGDLGATLWWTGAAFGSPADAVAVVRGAQSEISVHRDGERFFMVYTRGFGAADVVARTAPRPEGPWSGESLLFRPDEGDEQGIFIYSAKAHPELGGPLVVSYCTNHTDFFTMAARQDLYFPRFIRVRED